MKSDHTPLEIENGFRQFDLAVEIAQYYMHPERPFALRMPIVLDLQKEAVNGIEVEAGQIRGEPVGITESKHETPPAHLVRNLLIEFCDYINDNWHEKNAFFLSAYAMWRINWIHPFTDGNGRTARTLSYMLLCLKLGYVLPGSPTIPQQIEQDKAHYIRALEKADQACLRGEIDVSEMEQMIKGMLARQLLGVIEAAEGSQV
jgi:Fic family protein